MVTLPNIFLTISFATNLCLGFFVLAKSSSLVRKKINVIFSFLCFVAALWIFTAAMTSNSRVMDLKLFWIRMNIGISSFIPPLFFHFCLIFPNYAHDIKRIRTGLLYLPAVVLLVLSQSHFAVESIIRMEPSVYDYGVAHRFYAGYMVLLLGAGLYFLLKNYGKSAGIFRLQIRYCFLGMFFTCVIALFTNLLLPALGSSKYSKIGPSFTMIHVGFTTYAIVVHRLMDITVVLKKGTTYFLLTILLFAPSFLLVLWGQRFFFTQVSYLFSAFALGILFLVAHLYQKIKPRAEMAVEQYLFRSRYDYKQTLGAFSKALVSILDLTSLCNKIVETVTQTMGVERASLFLMSEEKGGQVLFASKNLPVNPSAPLLPKGDPLPLYLQKIGEVVIREELMKGSQIPLLRDVTDQMSSLHAEVSIPLIAKGELIGLMNLSHKFNKDVYSHEDIELLDTLANQAAVAIENARLYEDLKKSKSYIRRADRLASLGTLTAGLAHEIRNPLVAIKTFTQLLPERIDDEEFRNHFLQIASGEVDRISSLINELLEFARPSEPKFNDEEINVILDGMILLISTESKKRKIEMTKYYDPHMPPVQVDREQMKQVFLNVLLNAIDATPENGEITVRTRSFTKPGGESYLQVEFTDTGCGIPAEHLEEIFTPFFTTKTKGSGLGLSISNQIIQDHKGYIDVESRINQGTSFFINLPLRQEHPKRRKNDFSGQPELPGVVERG
jgi:two-component system, NtrC family, sensor kinase